MFVRSFYADYIFDSAFGLGYWIVSIKALDAIALFIISFVSCISPLGNLQPDKSGVGFEIRSARNSLPHNLVSFFLSLSYQIISNDEWVYKGRY